MKLLHLKFALLGVFVLAGYLMVRAGVDFKGPIKRIEPDELLSDGVKEKGELDILILGTSHGMAFRDLGAPEGVSVVNASQSGLGVAPLRVKGRYLIGQLKQVRNVVIVVDEWQIASATRSESTTAFDAYAFDSKFLSELVKEEVHRPVIARYVCGLFGNLPSLAYERAIGHRIEIREQQAFVNEAKSIGTINSAKAAGRAHKLYMGSTLEDARRLSSKLVDFAVEMEKEEKVGKVLFVFPPLPEVFRDQTPDISSDFKRVFFDVLTKKGASALDLASILPEDEFYSDEDHLTSDAARSVGRKQILPKLDLGPIDPEQGSGRSE